MTVRSVFNNGRILSEDEMRLIAPSIFATAPHESRSAKFKPIATIEVLRELAKEGFHPVSVQQQGARNSDRIRFSKHLIRMRAFHSDADIKNLQVGDTIAEVVLKNANDGTSLYQLFAGLFRIACLNGMVSQSKQLETMKIRHIFNDPNPRALMDQVIEGSYKITHDADRVLEAPRSWSKLQLESSARYSLASRAHHLTFADADGTLNTPIKPEQLLEARRESDKGTDLWSVFNVIQENVMRGGLENFSVRETQRWGRVETRVRTHPINAIDRSLKLNMGLFDLAESAYKELTPVEA